jgi:hypothetical protein
MHSVCGRCDQIHEYSESFRPTVCITALRRELRSARQERDAAKYAARKAGDMRQVIIDQQRHIEILEEEVLPRVRRVESVGVQEELL